MVTANLVDQIKIFNNQSVATPATFQVMLTINPSLYSTFEKSDLGNIRFYSDSALTQSLNSWIESSASNTSTSTIIWVKLTSAIAANSSTVIYMAFLATTTGYDGVQAGLAPQLPSTYAMNDNGAQVFTFYDNFNGAVLNASWDADTWAAGDVTVNNGVVINTYSIPGNKMALATAKTAPLMVDCYQKTNDATFPSSRGYVGVAALGTDLSDAVSGSPPGGTNGGYNLLQIYNGVTTDTIQDFVTPPGPGPPPQPLLVPITTFQVLSFGLDAANLYSMQNYVQIRKSTAGPYSLTIQKPGIHVSGAIATVRNTVQWFRTRQLPPNNVMPSSFRWDSTPANQKIRLGAGRFGQLGF